MPELTPFRLDHGREKPLAELGSNGHTTAQPIYHKRFTMPVSVPPKPNSAVVPPERAGRSIRAPTAL